MFFRIQFCFCNWKAMNCYVFIFLWIKFATIRFHFFSERVQLKLATRTRDPCNPSLGSLEDISPAQIYRADLTSVVSSFFPSILLFSVFLFLCSTFPVFYFLPFSSVFLCISSTFSSCLSCQPFTFFLATFYLFPLTFFAYHLVFLSASISFFVFCFMFRLASVLHLHSKGREVSG